MFCIFLHHALIQMIHRTPTVNSLPPSWWSTTRVNGNHSFVVYFYDMQQKYYDIFYCVGCQTTYTAHITATTPTATSTGSDTTSTHLGDLDLQENKDIIYIGNYLNVSTLVEFCLADFSYSIFSYCCNSWSSDDCGNQCTATHCSLEVLEKY